MTGDLYDAPNQQVVRGDGSGPGDEGTGGSEPQNTGGEQPQPQQPQGKTLDDMTKDELLAEADRRGVDADPSMTKSDIRAAIDAG